MKTLEGVVWGVITARGGSKTIPRKNLVPLLGRPLIDYVIRSAQATPALARLLCSTDSREIADVCAARGVEVVGRPERLAQDDVPSLDVLAHALETVAGRDGCVADLVALLEPTSPFLLPEHVDACVRALREDRGVDSAQTITPVAPNSHAYNQRRLRDGWVEFVFPQERSLFPNKQMKPAFYVHGNVRLVRSRCVLERRGLFGARSVPVVIPRRYALDVDGPEDVEIAEAMLLAKVVRVPE